jgi:Fanconi anemia group M protein
MTEVQKILSPKKVVIFVDHREENSGIIDFLREHDTKISTQQLKTADYITSDRVAIERKTISDFLQSIVDQRLFTQLQDIVEAYERPILILEGNPEIMFTERSIHPNTIRGVLSSIAVDYRVPILWTLNARETASQIFWLAYREQIKEKRDVAIRTNHKTCSIPKQQEFIVAGLPSINTKLSKRLLEEFGSVKNVFSCSEEMLKKVEGLGEKKAKKIFDLLNCGYSE